MFLALLFMFIKYVFSFLLFLYVSLFIILYVYFLCFGFLYAHLEVAVTFLVVNFFGLLVITRDHGSFERRH